MYVVVLGSAMIVTVIGVAALIAIRIERRGADQLSDALQASLYARSAIEIGLQRIASRTDWRSTFPNGVWESQVTLGTGTYTVRGVDPLDGDLADDHTDGLLLYGVGAQGDARYELEVLLEPDVAPLEALTTAIHAGSMTVKGGRSLTASGAPVSTNGHLKIDGGGIVAGDVHAGTLDNGGTVTGTVTVPAPTKSMPDSGLLSKYATMATAMAAPDTIEGVVISPTINPWGAGDPNGLYLITMAGGTLTVRRARLHGTLVVQTGGGKVVLDDTVFLHAYRADYPVLIVDGDVDLLYDTAGVNLSESVAATNFNPYGAPYLGVEDAAMDDLYPSEIQGLVHLTGSLRLKRTAGVRGTVICEGAVTADNDNEIVYDPNLYANPPWGYTTPEGMTIVPGTWRRIVN